MQGIEKLRIVRSQGAKARLALDNLGYILLGLLRRVTDAHLHLWDNAEPRKVLGWDET